MTYQENRNKGGRPKADYQTDKVVVDGKIITSRGMGTAIEFAAKLVEVLKGTKEKDELLESIVYGE